MQRTGLDVLSDNVRAQNAAHAQAKMKRFWYTLEEEGTRTDSSEEMTEVETLSLAHTPKDTKGKQRSIQEDDGSKAEAPSTLAEASSSQTLKEVDLSFTGKRRRGRPPKKRKLDSEYLGNLAVTATTIVGPTKGDDSTLNIPRPMAIQTQPADSETATLSSSAASSSTLKRKWSDITSVTSTASTMLQCVMKRMQSSDTPRPSISNALPSFSAPPPTASADIVEPKPVSLPHKPDGSIKLPGRLGGS